MLTCAAIYLKSSCTLFFSVLHILLIYKSLCSTLIYHLYFKQTFFLPSVFWRTGVSCFLRYSFILHQRVKRI